jgi:hypothetical protein
MNKDKEKPEDKEPKGSTNNVTDPNENILKDDFFKDLTDIDDGFDLDFISLTSKKDANIEDVVKDATINLDPKDPKKNIRTSVLQPAATVNKKKEREMVNKKLESLGLDPEDPSSKQFAEIWKSMDTPNANDFKLQVIRMEPAAIRGVKVSGYLSTFHMPTTIPDVVEEVGKQYGGGKYQVRIVNGAGKYVKSKTFDIAGMPKIPTEEVAAPVEIATPKVASKVEEDWDDDDDDFDPTPLRPSLRPRSDFGGFGRSQEQDFGFSSQYPSLRRRHDPSEDVKKDFDSKIRRVEDQIDSKFDKLTNLMAMQGQSKQSSFFGPEMFKHLAPVVGAYLESNRSKESSSIKQASDMNQQMANLMQGMQDLVRMSDKSKEGTAEKERLDREQYRREMMDLQQKQQERYLAQQQAQEERFQRMMLSVKEGYESQKSSESSMENSLRLESEKRREEAREREIKLMMESRERESQLREEARRREEETRARDFAMREQVRLEQLKFQEEMRRRDEESRQREMDRVEQMRIKEIQAITEQKSRELEIQERIRAMDSQKVEMQHKLMEQFYTSNIGQRDGQLQLEMAIAKLTSDNEQKHLQQLSQMELEKMKHATQMQIIKMKHDLVALEKDKQGEDPMDGALKDYLKRKLQIDMIKELGADYDDEDIPGNSISGIFKNIIKEGAGAVAPVISQLLSGGMAGGGMPRPPIGRVVNPAPPPTRQAPPAQAPQNPEDVGAETEDEGVEAYVTDETEVEEGEAYADEDLVEFDAVQELPRVAQFFDYIKESIDTGSATPKEAAVALRETLATPIVDYISGTTDSAAILVELQPLLVSYNSEFGEYFSQQHVLEWMDKMLMALNGVEPEPEPAPAPAPAPAPEPAPVVTKIPKPKKATKKTTTKKTTKAKASPKKEKVSKS